MSSNQPVASSSRTSTQPGKYDVALAERVERIRLGDQVILALPSTMMKMVEVKGEKTVSLGKFGSFPVSALIGLLYGITYAIVEPTEPGGKATLKPLQGESITEVEETMATNELIGDGTEQQLLSSEEIQKLKDEGASAQDIIAKQIAKHSSFHLKTVYSQEKYKKRKEQKYSKTFRPLAPTIPSLLAYHNARFAPTVMGMREDTFAQMLSFGNVHPGGRYIVIDDCGGLIVGGMLDRMGGKGRILTITDTDSPPSLNILQAQMNFPEEMLAETTCSLNWMTVEESWTPPDDLDTPLIKAAEKGHVGGGKNTRIKKKRSARDELLKTREELFAGEWDGLVIACPYEPYSIIEKLSKYLAGSSSIVVYSPYLQVLTDVQAILRTEPTYLNPTVTESWLRKYQVLPMRTHPFMTMSGTGGYILSAIKAYADQQTSSVLATRSAERIKAAARKRQKLAEAEAGAGGVSASASAVSSRDVSGVSTPVSVMTATVPVPGEGEGGDRGNGVGPPLTLDNLRLRVITGSCSLQLDN
ncbi:tRNA(1-methyladenosine) methyltransferase, subunit GCD10 [Phaffia rhodozyma]|uniref:tRNA (adenine(58)-N(1))-methyltransferase non-catalytic subunit TRM6 n=1 Tax=Phaffia rhodozyma TaxID=264483 RepID=A0A0F7SH12_PHARH|nr:tRNA(1-methyladenosine) methyltransferase, subunit GCD10 [Phaffia rhodozyma]